MHLRRIPLPDPLLVKRFRLGRLPEGQAAQTLGALGGTRTPNLLIRKNNHADLQVGFLCSDQPVCHLVRKDCHTPSLH